MGSPSLDFILTSQASIMKIQKIILIKPDEITSQNSETKQKLN